MKAKILMIVFSGMLVLGLWQGEAGRIYRHALLVCLSCLGIR